MFRSLKIFGQHTQNYVTISIFIAVKDKPAINRTQIISFLFPFQKMEYRFQFTIFPSCISSFIKKRFMIFSLITRGQQARKRLIDSRIKKKHFKTVTFHSLFIQQTPISIAYRNRKPMAFLINVMHFTWSIRNLQFVTYQL